MAEAYLIAAACRRSAGERPVRSAERDIAKSLGLILQPGISHEGSFNETYCFLSVAIA